MVTTAEELARLDAEELADALTDIARVARASLAEGDRITPLRQLRAIQSAADSVGGERLRLLEITAAFLKTVAQANFTRLELALREFLDEFPDDGASFLTSVLDRSAAEAVLERIPSSLRAGVAHLEELGLIRRERGRLDLSPQWRIAVKNLLEPAVLRHWREVDRARTTILANRLGEADAALTLSGSLGIETEQARRFLKRSPVRPMASLDTVLTAKARGLRHLSARPATRDPEMDADQEPVPLATSGAVANSPASALMESRSPATSESATPSLMN
jgi:hypothetical protein